MSVRNYEAFFREADRDGSNALTVQELSDMLKSKGYKCDQDQLTQMFNEVDCSGDKKITFEEYMATMQAQPEPVHKGAVARQLFASFDKDGSGVIDKGELKAALQGTSGELSGEDIQRMMDLCDEDDSGTINQDEFINKMFGDGA